MSFLPETPHPLQRRRQVILGLFVALALVYMLTSPIFEVSDEMLHFPVVDYIASTGKLPYQDPGTETLWRQEGSQPPLYYMLAAVLVLSINRSDLEDRLFYNPHAKVGIGLATDNQNIVVHDPAAESFPYKNTTLAVMFCRLFSILLGAGTVWLTFDVTRLTLPARPALGLLAMALVAFNPMFLFITASVNNDNLVIFLGTAILVLMLTLWQFGWHWGRIGGLSILLGLAALTKLSGLTFTPIAALTIFLVYLRERRPLKDLFLAGGMVAVGIGIIAGWWYIRNIQLYDDPTGLNTMIEIAGKRPTDFGLSGLWAEREGFYYAYWGWFGGLNVISPQRFFDYTLVIFGIALVGLAILFFKKRHLPIPILLLMLQLGLMFVGVVRWALQTPASQGRLIFPGIAIIGVLLAIGLAALFEVLRLPASKFATIAVLPLVAYALVLPFTVIRPAYSPPETVAELPADARQTDASFGPIRLLAYEIDATPIILHDDIVDEIEITLYWQPQANTETPLSFYIQVFGPAADLVGEPVVIGKLDSFPGQGLRRTDTWEIGKIYAETYRIEIDSSLANAPFEPRFKIGWRDHFAGTEIAATTLDQSPLAAVILRGGTIAEENSECPVEPSYIYFGDLANLRANLQQQIQFQVEAGGLFDLSVTWASVWKPQTRKPDNFTIFVQVTDDKNPPDLWGSGDAAPREDWYPTGSWVEGTCFTDTYHVHVKPDTPPGRYSLRIGFYRPTDGVRLPLQVTLDNAPPPFPDYYLLGTVIVTAPLNQTPEAVVND